MISCHRSVADTKGLEVAPHWTYSLPSGIMCNLACNFSLSPFSFLDCILAMATVVWGMLLESLRFPMMACGLAARFVGIFLAINGILTLGLSGENVCKACL